MRRRESNTAERTWREDQRSRPTTRHSKKGVKQPKAISVKHVVYALLAFTIIIEVIKYVVL
ncbi:MAG TPA: hypothetical protein VJM50_23995 [Pyrinomonadaceae bacterium]|nr:hypothetical protein [Pyrinomonadaceae bacterium]